MLVCVLLSPCLAAHGQGGPPPAGPAERWTFFSYQTEQGRRICRGNTTRGDAECVDGTSESATLMDGKAPRFSQKAGARIGWLRYPSPGEGSAPGMYAFFTYQASEKARICAGNTATGTAMCVDGTATWSRTLGTSRPVYQTTGGHVLTALRYFEPKRNGKPGDHAFGAYALGDSARVCVMETASGETICADGTTTFARAKVGKPLNWQRRRAATRYLRFFRAPRRPPTP